MTMSTNTIKVFQVDDWAYVAAQSADEAEAFIEAEPGRADDPEDRDLEEVTPTGNLAALLQKHIELGQGFPALIAIDKHYA